MRFADALLGLGLLLVVWSFYRAQKDPGNVFNLFDLLMEQGRISKVSVAFITTLCVTSWIMLRLALDGKLTEGYFTGYGLMWVAPLVAKLFNYTPPPGTRIIDTVDSSKVTTRTVDTPKEHP